MYVYIRVHTYIHLYTHIQDACIYKIIIWLKKREKTKNSQNLPDTLENMYVYTRTHTHTHAHRTHIRTKIFIETKYLHWQWDNYRNNIKIKFCMFFFRTVVLIFIVVSCNARFCRSILQPSSDVPLFMWV